MICIQEVNTRTTRTSLTLDPNLPTSKALATTIFITSTLFCLHFLVPPDIQLEKTSSDTTVNEGEDATLVCHATGRPVPTILWRREDGKAFRVKNHKRMGNLMRLRDFLWGRLRFYGFFLHFQWLLTEENFWYCSTFDGRTWVPFCALPKMKYPRLWAKGSC